MTAPEAVQEYTLSDEERRCPKCTDVRQIIGHESWKELEYIPGRFAVTDHRQVKYGCRTCDGHIVLAPRTSAQPIAKGMPGFGLLANTIENKYANHLPLYRQEQMYERQGVKVARSSMSRWLAVCAEKVRPIYERMRDEVLQSRIIHADETPVKFQRKGAGKAPTGYAWTYLGHEDHPYVIFEWHPDRGHKHAQDFLNDFAGYVQADAYGGYDALASATQAKRLCCMAHARRYFERAQGNNPRIADEALARIHVLYEIERQGNLLEEDDRHQLRQREAVPRLVEMHDWMRDVQTRTLPKSAIGEALQYSVSRWSNLTRYTERGFLPIDNNAAERALRPVAVGRKNWCSWETKTQATLSQSLPV
ncbi:MAG: IS66 family transposase [Candidatus Obscuribacterales bacterium]